MLKTSADGAKKRGSNLRRDDNRGIKVSVHAEEGARPMVVTIPPRIKSFCGQFEGMLSEAKHPALSWLLAAYLLVTGRRTQSAIARGVLSEARSPSSVSRRMRGERFRTRDLVRVAMKGRVTDELRRVGGREEVWFLVIDGVATKRGGGTKIGNAFRCVKPRRTKGRSSKAHHFVMGLLLTASGARIPLPRRTYYTKEYIRAEKQKRKKGRRLVYKTQLDLACLIIKELRLPENITLVVLADEYFEGTKLTNLCRRKGHAFIAPVDSRRTFTPRKSLHARGKALARRQYRTLTLRQGEEGTASHRRHVPRGARKKDPRVYRYCCERRAVAKTGEVAVVYSWKRKRDRSGKPTSRETFKVLVCSDPSLFGEGDEARIGAKIVEFYEMRWQVEVFFRELKSDLGLEDYRGCDFGAFERHVDLTMLSFMCLEDMRREEMARTRSPVKRREYARGVHHGAREIPKGAPPGREAAPAPQNGGVGRQRSAQLLARSKKAPTQPKGDSAASLRPRVLCSTGCVSRIPPRSDLHHVLHHCIIRQRGSLA
jgi:hypothetical protein